MVSCKLPLYTFMIYSKGVHSPGNIISIAFQPREQDVNNGLENESISEQTSSTDQPGRKSEKPTSANEGAVNVLPTNTKQEQSVNSDHVIGENCYCEIPPTTLPEKGVVEDVTVREGASTCADLTIPREPIRKDTCNLWENKEKSGLPFERHLHDQSVSLINYRVNIMIFCFRSQNNYVKL